MRAKDASHRKPGADLVPSFVRRDLRNNFRLGRLDGPWGPAISPRGDMPKYRVPLSARRFCMSKYLQHLPKSATLGRRALPEWLSGVHRYGIPRREPATESAMQLNAALGG